MLHVYIMNLAIWRLLHRLLTINIEYLMFFFVIILVFFILLYCTIMILYIHHQDSILFVDFRV